MHTPVSCPQPSSFSRARASAALASLTVSGKKTPSPWPGHPLQLSGLRTLPGCPLSTSTPLLVGNLSHCFPQKNVLLLGSLPMSTAPQLSYRPTLCVIIGMSSPSYSRPASPSHQPVPSMADTAVLTLSWMVGIMGQFSYLTPGQCWQIHFLKH